MTQISVLGAAGRMGQAVIRAVAGADGLTLSGALVRHNSPAAGQDAGRLAGIAKLGVMASDDLVTALSGADVAIDFTLPDATVFNISGCETAGCALVIGTTGHDQGQIETIRQHAFKVPVVLAPNMSPGVAVLYALAGAAARSLPGFDAEIVEIHHSAKRDAPSGTALRLAETVAAARGQDLAQDARFGRGRGSAPRRLGEIGVSAVRAGTVVGEHTLILAGPGERLELRHTAQDRDSFAGGAVRAARWVTGRSPGLYGMSDVLGLAGQPE